MTSVLTSDQLNMLRGGGYEGSSYVVAGPQNTVFAARVNGAPSATSDDFAQVAYDTVTTGAYTDLIVDMDVRISHTNDVRKAFFLGRLRKTPTSTILYINESSKDILDNDYLFVIANYPLKIRQRYKNFVDWDRPYEGLGPVEKNIDSAYCTLTTAATAQLSFSSLPQALTKGTTVASRLWNFPGASYIVGSSTSADITIEVTTPYNAFCHETLTDSAGVTRTLHFTVTAGDPNTGTFFRLCHEPPTVASDWDNGLSTALTFWAGVDDLLDKTRVSIVAAETFDGDALGVGNVLFVGYLKSRTSNTAGDETYGQRKDVQWECNGFMQLASELRFNQIAIRHASSPSAWDSINIPTYQRNICHLLAHHSTLLNLVSMDFGTIDDTFSSGNSNLGENSLTDAARACIKEVNGYLINGQAGKISLIRDPRVGDNTYRATIPNKTPSPIDLGDGYSFKLDTDPDDKVGWMEVGFVVIQPTSLARTYITANAPASGPGDGQEDDSNPSQLLAATGTIGSALNEARQRTRDLYALANTHRTLEWALVSGWGGVVYATPGEYYQFLIDPADDVAGVGVDAEDNWLCVSVQSTINSDGTQATTARFMEVTQGFDSLIKVAVSPSVASTPTPVLPFASPYPSQPVAASINYDSVDPTQEIPRDPFSGLQLMPLTTEEAAEAAQKQAGPGKTILQISFRNPTAVNTGFISALGTAYDIHFTGFARITDGTHATVPANVENSGNGFDTGLTVTSGDSVAITCDPADTWEGGTHIAYNADGESGSINPFAYAPSAEIYSMIYRIGTSGAWTKAGLSRSFTAAVTGTLYLMCNDVPSGYSDNLGSITATVTGLSASPVLYADAFYKGQLDPVTGKWTNVTPNTAGGVRIDNNGIAIFPDYNENHEYDASLDDFNGTGGTGSVLAVKFLDTTYTDNELKLMTLTFNGTNTGS